MSRKTGKKKDRDGQTKNKIKEAYHVGEAREISEQEEGKRRKACMTVLKLQKMEMDIKGKGKHVGR